MECLCCSQKASNAPFLFPPTNKELDLQQQRPSASPSRGTGECDATAAFLPGGLPPDANHPDPQSRHYERLIASQMLSEEELDLLRWARNVRLQNFPKRFKPAKGQDSTSEREVYRNATCFEALVGDLGFI